MKIEANDKEIQDIISLGYFKIPRFQRPYSWELDEVESFWDDIIKDNSENYFIGSMVVYQAKKPYFGIVDGQQRLTTITLILSAIRNGFIKLGEENLARGVHKYIEKANIDNEDEFVLNAETSYPYLQNNIQSFNGFRIDCEVGIEEQKLKAAFDLISDKLCGLIPGLTGLAHGQQSLFSSLESQSVHNLKEIRDKILSLKLVFIQLDNEDDAYLIFETLNARGRDLTTSDLIKNLLLKKIKTRSATLDKAKESWNSLIKKFDDISDSSIIDAFLLHYWLSEYEYTTDKELFSKVKNHISDGEEKAKELLDKLHANADYYCRLVKPENHEWSKEECDIKNTLQSLNLFKVKQQTAMVLSLLRAYYEKNITLRNLKNIFKKMENFHYAFNAVTSQRSSGSIASVYSRFAIALTNANGDNNVIQKILNELFVTLRAKMPEKEEFLIKFHDFSYLSKKTKHKAIIRYSLSRLVDGSFGGLPVDKENLTIEHIVPEAYLKQGVDEGLIGNIGNLVLIDSKTNSDILSNKSPLEKINLLKEMGYPLKNALIPDYMSERDIKKRSDDIARTIYELIQI